MDICRLCLSKESDSIIKDVTAFQQLPRKIEQCVSISITTADCLPKTVCLTCLQTVNNWYDFRELCCRSDTILKNSSQGNQDAKNKIESVKASVKNEWAAENQIEHSSQSFISDCEAENECKTKFQYDELDKEEFQLLPYTYTCEYCQKEFDMCLEYLEHQNIHEGEPVFKCGECSEIFTSKSSLAHHEKYHMVLCSMCGKTVSRPSMKLHLIQHSDRHKCPYCQRGFSCNATMEQHIITVHTDIKNHICENCGKCFSSKSSLIIHSKTHQNTREYQCKMCSYAGRTASAIYIHMSKHAKESHCCKMCGKIFKSSRNLSDHRKRVHIKEKKHECSYCGLKFIEQYMLKVHMRIHTGVRPYGCNICNKNFMRSDSLKEHMNTHGPRDVMACNRCFKKFMTKRGYERHNCLGSEESKELSEQD